MAAKTTLNAKNLEALGPERLAELLIEISAGNAAARRRLRLELAGARSPSELAKEVRKRLTVIARSAPFLPPITRAPAREADGLIISGIRAATPFLPPIMRAPAR